MRFEFPLRLLILWSPEFVRPCSLVGGYRLFGGVHFFFILRVNVNQVGESGSHGRGPVRTVGMAGNRPRTAERWPYRVIYNSISPTVLGVISN